MNRRLLASSARLLSRNRMRTFFMSIGVAIGVATLVAGRSLGVGSEQELRRKIDIIFGPGTMLVIAKPNLEAAPGTPLSTETVTRRGVSLT